jgi:hypothetical protein
MARLLRCLALCSAVCHHVTVGFDPSKPVKNQRPASRTNRVMPSTVAAQQELAPTAAPHRLVRDRRDGLPFDGLSKDLADEVKRRDMAPRGEEEVRSEYVGVYWDKKTESWKSQIVVDGSTRGLGYFDHEMSAAMAYDTHAALHRKPLNFPTEDGQKRAVKRARKRPMVDLSFVSKGFSEFVGVSWMTSTQKWASYIYIGGKKKGCGYFDDEIDAAKSYDEAAAKLGRPVNFPTAPGQKQARKRKPDRRAQEAKHIGSQQES